MSQQRHSRRSQPGTTPTTPPQIGSGVAQFSVSEVAQFSVSEVAQFSMSLDTVRGLEPATLLGGSCARHLVDSGLSCFIDASARPAFAAARKEHSHSTLGAISYWDVLAQDFRDSADDPSNPSNPSNPFLRSLRSLRFVGFVDPSDPSDPSDPGDYCLHAFSADTTARLAMFSSGLGDGVYTTYWALGDAGRRIGLLTDFDLLSRSGRETSA